MTAFGDVLLDDARAWPGHGLLFRNASSRITAKTLADVPRALLAMDRAVAGGNFVAGAFAYELGLALEPRLTPLLQRGHGPLIDVYVHDAPVALSGAQVLALLPAGGAYLGNMAPSISREAYASAFARVKELIAAGDIYQANLTFPLTGRCAGDPLALYRALRFGARAGFAALMRTPERTILSLSPELFLDGAGGTLKARPMKGTCPRDPDPARDAAIAAKLARDEKQRAENLMIVDLLRNDLSRIAEGGSVRVTDLFSVETYPSLHTMTSGVAAAIDPATPPSHILKALFPCGSVTGAPKIRAMEVIHELEGQARGVYCGALGAFGPGGFVKLNVAIRTLTIDANGRAIFNVGSGVVADSGEGDEYDECLLKARFALEPTPPFELIETMRLSRGRGVVLLSRHLERVKKAARWFNFAFDEDEFVRALHAIKSGAADQRVRAGISADGAMTLACEDLPPCDWVDGLPREPGEMKVVIAPAPLVAGDPFVRWKTSRRDHYETPLAEAKAQGADEVIFLNARGELCEAARTSIFVPRDGVLLTPPLDAPCLDGVLRAELLSRGLAREAVLTPNDLAGGFYLGNAVRGLKAASLGPAPSATV